MNIIHIWLWILIAFVPLLSKKKTTLFKSYILLLYYKKLENFLRCGHIVVQYKLLCNCVDQISFWVSNQQVIAGRLLLIISEINHEWTTYIPKVDLYLLKFHYAQYIVLILHYIWYQSFVLYEIFRIEYRWLESYKAHPCPPKICAIEDFTCHFLTTKLSTCQVLQHIF